MAEVGEINNTTVHVLESKLTLPTTYYQLPIPCNHFAITSFSCIPGKPLFCCSSSLTRTSADLIELSSNLLVTVVRSRLDKAR